MRVFALILLGGAISVAGLFAMQATTKAKDYRTSPTGYTDTPVLPGQKWKVHDAARPRPPIVTPGAKPGDPPSDAIILFDGKDLAQWESQGQGADKGKMVPAKWRVDDGFFEIIPKTGDLVTKQKFGDIQLHIEWSELTELAGDSQWRGNSGVLLMGRYEIQVLDSYDNLTYADGQAASIYGQWPPQVNVTRPPGQWNVYDIVFEAPKFEGANLVKPAFVTVIHNGVVVHNRKEIGGRMAHRVVGTYAPHAAEESLALQDHDVRVRYRNIWVRKLKGYDSN
jgi:hypothetical protein